MRRRFKKYLACIMAALMLCSVYVVPAGAAQDEGVWNDIKLYKPADSILVVRKACYSYKLKDLPSEARVEWSLNGTLNGIPDDLDTYFDSIMEIREDHCDFRFLYYKLLPYDAPAIELTFNVYDKNDKDAKPKPKKTFTITLNVERAPLENPGNYSIQRKEGGAVPATIPVGEQLSLVLVKDTKKETDVKTGPLDTDNKAKLVNLGLIGEEEAGKEIIAIKAENVQAAGGIRYSTGKNEFLEAVIGTTEASEVVWASDSGPYKYKVTESAGLREIVESATLEGSIPAVGENQSGNTDQSEENNDYTGSAQSEENDDYTGSAQSEENDDYTGSTQSGNTSVSEGTTESGGLIDSYYIGIGNTEAPDLDFDIETSEIAGAELQGWSTSDGQIATIDSNGVLKGIKPGKVRIAGTYIDENNVKGGVYVDLEVEDNTIGAIQTGQGDEGKTSGNNMGIQSGGSTDEKPMIEAEPEPAGGAPSIEGINRRILEEGYGDTPIEVTIFSDSKPVMSLSEKTAKVEVKIGEGPIKYPDGAYRQSFLLYSGLTVGTHSFTVTAKNDYGTATFKIELEVRPKKTPQITGEDTINLEVGYEPVQYDYSATGEPKPTVSLLDEGNTAKATMTNGVVTIPQDLGVGSYSFTLQAKNSRGTATKTVTVNVGEKPQITGSEIINLEEGYSSVPYEYGVTGYPEPVVSILAEGNSAKAVMEEGKVTIPSGLGVGQHTFTLQAENIAGTATKTVTVNVGVKPQITGLETVYLEEGYSSVPYEYSVTGEPKPTVSLLEDSNTAKATMTNGEVTIPQGLSVGSHSFTLQAENIVGTATKTVTVNVSPRYVPVSPQIQGADTVELNAGYSDTEYNYSISGDPWPTVSLSEEEGSNTAGATLENEKVTIPAGLGAEAEYFFTLEAVNSVGKATKTVRVVVAPEKEKPTISGERTIYLYEGYRSLQYNYTVTGYPKPEVNVLDDNSAGAEISNGIVTIPAGLDAGLAGGSEYTFTLEVKNSVGRDEMVVTVVVKPKAQPTDPDPIVPADKIMPKQLQQSTKSKSGIQKNEKDQAKEPAEEAEPVEEPVQKETAPTKEPEKESASPKEPVKKDADLAKEPAKEKEAKEPAVKKEEPVKEPAKETAKAEGTTKEPAVKDEDPKQEPAE